MRMLTIQEVGLEILNNRPKKFYVFLGPEYGIKNKYIKHLETLYGCKEEYSSVSELLSVFHKKRLIPLSDKLYVVRYDEQFSSDLDESSSSYISKTNIPGTVVCLYEDTCKGINKIHKYLDDFCVSMDPIDKKFIEKYIKTDNPGVSDKVASIASSLCQDYYNATSIYNCIRNLEYSSYTEEVIRKIVCPIEDNSSSERLKVLFASKNVPELLLELDTTSVDYNEIFYLFLNVLIELDKLVDASYSSSRFKAFAKIWNHRDTYNMFSIIYKCLEDTRSISSDVYQSLLYCVSCLAFNPTLELKELSC